MICNNDLTAVENRLERHLSQISNDIGRAHLAIEHRVGLLESEVTRGRKMLSDDIKSIKEALHGLTYGSIRDETASISFARKAIAPSPCDGTLKRIERILSFHSIPMLFGVFIGCVYMWAIQLICMLT